MGNDKNQDGVADDQAPMEAQPSAEQQQAQSGASAGHTVGPNYPGVTGTPEQGNRDMERVEAENLDDNEDDEV